MSLDAFPERATQPDVVRNLVRILGTGAANPTKVFGAGVTVTRVSDGRYRFVWGDAPGEYIGMVPGFQATTPADVDGFTAVAGEYSASTKTVDVYVYDDTPALANLAALNWLTLDFIFKRTGSTAG